MCQAQNINLATIVGEIWCADMCHLYIYIEHYCLTELMLYVHIYTLLRFICTFLTKAACCRNIEIVLHPTTLSYIKCVVVWCFSKLIMFIYVNTLMMIVLLQIFHLITVTQNLKLVKFSSSKYWKFFLNEDLRYNNDIRQLETRLDANERRWIWNFWAVPSMMLPS